MRLWKISTALIAAGMIVLPALAQDKKPEAKPEKGTEKKTESGKEGEGKSDAAKDRGDKKAENLLKKAYMRVHSAEADGLKKLYAEADIAVDASAFGFGEMPFPGNLYWETGGKATWSSADDEGEAGSANPLGNVSEIVKQLFEPYLAYVAGFEAWDSRFKVASFKLLDPAKDEAGKVIEENVEVTYEKGEIEVFQVADNKVVSFSRDAELQGQKAKVKISFEYEDTGKKLRPTKVTGDTELEMAGMPGQQPDPKNPVPRGPATKERLEGSIKVKKWGKAGTFEVATELEGSIKLGGMGVEFPATLELTNIKINDDVKDEHKPKAGGTDDGKSDDDEF